MEQSIKNIIKVLDAMLDNKVFLLHREEEQSGKGSEYARRQSYELGTIWAIRELLRDEEYFKVIAKIYLGEDETI